MTDHDEILEAVFLGEAAPDDPEVRDHLAGCASCRERLDRLLGVSRELDGLAVEEREDLAAARAAAGSDEPLTPGFEALLDEHRVHAPSPSEHRGSSGWRPLRVILTIAALLAIVLMVRQLLPTGVDPPTPDPFLGDERPLELVRPLTLPTLRWTFDLPPGGYFVLEIEDDTDEGRGRIVVDRVRVFSNEWSPSDSILPLEMPAAFLLRIEAYDRDDVRLGALPEERLP